MTTDQIQRILVVGGGTMGRQIALQCAIYGFNVTLHDIEASALEAALPVVETHAEKLAEDGRFSEEIVAGALQRLSYDRVPCDVAAATDILIEAASEDPGVKASIFSKFNKFCPERTVFATNTSSLRPSKIAKATGRPDRFAAFHFHIPVWDANVVDIMPHPGTSRETIGLLAAFAKQIGQIPILMEKEGKSYVFNTMLNGILRSSLHLAASETASIEDIDRSWMAIMGMPIGPFGIMDRIGIDLVYQIARRSTRFVRFVPRVRRALGFLEHYVETGRLGVKSKEGFYAYPKPAFEEDGFLDGAQQ